MDIQTYVQQLGTQATNAFHAMVSQKPAKRTEVLLVLADCLEKHKDRIMHANAKDVQTGEKNLAPQLLDRLTLSPARFAAMVQGVHDIALLADPVSAIKALTTRPSGIRVGKMRSPLGVILMIYESRPNVTIDACALNLRVGNAIILRGGSESFTTNMALYEAIADALEQCDLPRKLVQYIETTDREVVRKLIEMDTCIDLVIPRGSKKLIENIVQYSRVNVLKHLDGNCHIFVDEYADITMANTLVHNAKTRRYGVCNALESLLVAQPIAQTFFQKGIADRLIDAGVTLHVCEKSRKVISNNKVVTANEDDYYTEYLGPDLSVKIVANLDEAIVHINHYGSHHTDAIVTNNIRHAERFLVEVDSSSVMVNASTAFADGFEYGLGAEIGISTDKFHARGPVGLEGLTSEKYVVLGNGEIRP